MNEAEKRGYKKVRITKDSCGWQVGTIAWINEYDEAWDDDCTEYWLHSIGYDCEYVEDAQMKLEVGTLAEIGAQVGDVVDRVFDGGTSERHVIEGIEKIEHGIYKWEYRLTLSDYGTGIFDDEQFRIISRAQPQPTGPVITEIVTTKRIVPGVYGMVRIEDISDRIGILVDDYFTRADLIAARDVFNQLIEAMEE